MTRLFCLLIALALLLAACAAGTPTTSPPPAQATATLAPTMERAPASPTPAPAAPTETSPPPTEPAAPTVGTGSESEGDVLPSALYFLSLVDSAQQVWRLERDGVTATQLTHEAEGVTDFDVSPLDGSLVFIAGSALLRADRDGGNRALLYAMQESDALNSPFMEARLSNPRWSPDGQQIAFGLNGLNLIPAGGGARQLLLASDPPPDPTAPRQGPSRFYQPDSWSPDGSRLLVQVIYFPEGGELASYEVATGTLTPFASLEALPTGAPTWSADSRMVFFGNPTPGLFNSGLWRADVETGEVTSLSGERDAMMGLPEVALGHAHASQDGFLYGFVPFVGDNPSLEALYAAPYLIERAPVERAGERAAWEVVTQDPLRPIEVQWAPDTSGAAVTLDEGQGWQEQGNPLYWVPVADAPVQPLSLMARLLRWEP